MKKLRIDNIAAGIFIFLLTASIISSLVSILVLASFKEALPSVLVLIALYFGKRLYIRMFTIPLKFIENTSFFIDSQGENRIKLRENCKSICELGMLFVVLICPFFFAEYTSTTQVYFFLCSFLGPVFLTSILLTFTGKTKEESLYLCHRGEVFCVLTICFYFICSTAMGHFQVGLNTILVLLAVFVAIILTIDILVKSFYIYR